MSDLRTLVGGSGRIPCLNPDHDDHGADMQVYEDHLYCFSCAANARQSYWPYEEAIQILTGIDDLYQAQIAADRQVGVVRSHKRGGRDSGPLDPALADAYHEALVTDYFDRTGWLEERGISLETIMKERIGYGPGAFVLPVWDDTRTGLLTLRFRRDPAYSLPGDLKRSKYYGVAGHNDPLPYGVWWVPRLVEALVVVEGEFDALLLHQHFAYAVTLTNGAGQLDLLIPYLAQRFPALQLLLLAPDLDDAGEEAATACARKAKRLGLATTRVRWDRALGKDVGEYLLHEGDPDIFSALHYQGTGKGGAHGA